MICFNSKICFIFAKACNKLQLVVIALAFFVSMVMSGCRTKSSATSAVVASATIGTMEAALMDSSCQVVQWDVWVTDTIGDSASWVPIVRKTFSTKRHALANAHTNAVKKDTTTIVESNVPHSATSSIKGKDIMELSPIQLLLYRIGLIVCIFGLFFGISYIALAYFRKNA